ncbi:hypothetical protein [uncultured Algoriphagus sp.]|uniref:hypothetical protein n=1 Tax=uncultured Algoriphagus sp. TaxID=417365 RepID=UPI0030EC9305
MYHRILIALFCSTFLIGCSKDEEPYQELMVSADETFLYEDVYGYVFLQEANESKTEFHSIANSETVYFKTLASKDYHLTYFTVYKYPSYDRILLTTYTHVKPEGEIILGLGNERPISPAADGTFTVTVSDKNGEVMDPIASSSFGSSNSSVSYSNGNAVVEVFYFPTSEKYLISAKGADGINKFKYLSGVEKGGFYTIDIDEMSLFDQSVEWDLSSYEAVYTSTFSLSPQSAFNEEGYQTSLNEYEKFKEKFPGSPVTLSYPNGYQRYLTYLELYHKAGSDQGRTMLSKYGGLPDPLQFLPSDQNIEVSKTSISDFEFTPLPWSNQWSAIFAFNSNGNRRILWSVSGEVSSFKLVIPEELKNMYPEFERLEDFEKGPILSKLHSQSYKESLRSIFYRGQQKLDFQEIQYMLTY